MIWGMTLEPGKLYTEIMGEEVQLSMAAIDSRKDLDENSKSFCQIVINTDKGEYVLCTLVHGVMFQQSLDLKLMPREKVTFSVQGPSVVYLVGYTASYPEDEGLEMEDGEENLEGEGDVSAWESFEQEEESFEQIKEEPGEMAEDTSEIAEVQLQEDEGYREEEGSITQVEQEGTDDMEGSQNNREEEIIFSVPDLEPSDLKSEAPTPQPDSTPIGSQMVPSQMGEQQGGMFDIQNQNTRTPTSDFFYPETQQLPAVPVTPPVSFQPTSSATEFQPPNPQGVLPPSETYVPPQRTMTQSHPQRNPHPAQGSRGGIQQMNIQRTHAHPSRQYGTNTNEPSSKSRTRRPANVQQSRRVSNIQSVPGTSKQDMPGPSSSSAGQLQQGARMGRVSQASPHYCTPQQLPPSIFSQSSRWQYRRSAVMTSVINNSNSFICKYCRKSFISAQKLKAHERFHESIGRFPCRFCARGFANCEDLKRHERVHTGEKPYKCSYCSRAFARHSTLRSHETIHTGVKPFRCQACEKGFVKRSLLRVHKEQHGH